MHKTKGHLLAELAIAAAVASVAAAAEAQQVRAYLDAGDEVIATIQSNNAAQEDYLRACRGGIR